MLTLVAVSAMFVVPSAVEAQDLIDLLHQRRQRAIAEAIISQDGQMAIRSPESLPVETRLPMVALNQQNTPGSVEFNLFKVRRIPKLGRPWFEEKFKDLDWAFLGSNDLSSVDTTFTWQIRSMLEAGYGAPTQTITDLGYWRTLTKEQFIQFEYWFVLNNEIPLIVVDTNGPFERGVVVASDARNAKILAAIRNAVLEPLLSAGEMALFIDYYYDEEYDAWYETGYDGEELFVRPIRTSQIGNSRPVLVKD